MTTNVTSSSPALGSPKTPLSPGGTSKTTEMERANTAAIPAIESSASASVETSLSEHTLTPHSPPPPKSPSAQHLDAPFPTKDPDQTKPDAPKNEDDYTSLTDPESDRQEENCCRALYECVKGFFTGGGNEIKTESPDKLKME